MHSVTNTQLPQAVYLVTLAMVWAVPLLAVSEWPVIAELTEQAVAPLVTASMVVAGAHTLSSRPKVDQCNNPYPYVGSHHMAAG